jgi:hypothetical protein
MNKKNSLLINKSIFISDVHLSTKGCQADSDTFDGVLLIGYSNFNFSILLFFENLITFIFFPLHILISFNEVKQL